MRKVLFESDVALRQFQEWEKEDPKVFGKIITLLNEARQTPFSGLGKPEPLKHQLKGCWSRRINREHRLIYKVTSDSIIIIACKYHY